MEHMRTNPYLWNSENRLSLCVSLSVSLSICPFRELLNANSEPIELGMVLNEGEDRKTLLRRGRPLRRCLVLEI